MKKKILLLVVFLLLLAMIVVFNNYRVKKQSRACFKNYCFDVELAETSQEKSSGLMFRESLDSKKGMLFIYDKEDVYNFWMKNVLISLDIVWIDDNKQVIFISHNTQPCKDDPCPVLKPPGKAKYVLELSGGTCQKIGLSVGDKIEIEY